MPDWKKIKAEYIRGSSYRKLADKYGVSFSTIRSRGASEKWTDLRKESREKADKKIVESVARADAKRAEKLQTITDLLLDAIKENLESGTFTGEAKDVKAITSALRDLKDINGFQSDLDKQEQIARIEKLRKDAKEEEKTDTSIRIIMGDDVKDYVG